MASTSSVNGFTLYDGNVATVSKNENCTTVSFSTPDAPSTAHLIGHLLTINEKQMWGDPVTLNKEFSVAGDYLNQIAEAVKAFCLQHANTAQSAEIEPPVTPNTWLRRLLTNHRIPGNRERD